MQIRLFTIPNLITLGNLLCGCMALVAVLAWGDLALAFALVAAAAVFDFLDGFTARLLKQYSAIGVQLDSLADMVSFGAVPAAAMYALAAASRPAFAGWEPLPYLCFVVAAFSALRLAKFNIDETQHTEFVGLPTPACALFCTSLGMLFAQGRLALPQEAVVAVAVAMACLLIAPLRMFSLKFHGFGRGNELRYAFLAAAGVAIVLLRAYSIPAIVVLYAVISAVRHFVQRNDRTHSA